jgi:hypothetical protein
MNPPLFDTNTVTSTVPAPPGFNIEVVREIIRKRKAGALSGLTIVAMVLTVTAIFNQSVSKTALAIAALMLLVPLTCIYILNASNYPDPKPSYRIWNTWIYNYASKLLIIGIIFKVLSNIRSIANPMHGFNDTHALTRTALAGETAVEAGMGIITYSNLKPAKYVEEYFKLQGDS